MKLAGGIFVFLAIGVLVWLGIEDLSDRHMFKPGGSGAVCENLSSQEVAKLIATQPGLIILDVRSSLERQAGSLSGAVAAPTGSAEFQAFLAETGKDKPILVYCSGGVRSRMAIAKLKKEGFTNLHHLNRGYLGWVLAGGDGQSSE